MKRADLPGLTAASARAPSDAPLAECRQLTVAYRRDLVALDKVDVELFPGERVALWGPSGSGKTTLLHALGGLVEPTSGRILWNGAPLSSLEMSARTGAHGIAYVFQRSNLLRSFTVYENVAFAAFSSGVRSNVEREALDLLALVGLRGKLDNLSSELSGGERQRVAIARALAQHPKVLLCDEPTGHLDADTTTRMLELVDALHLRLGFTLVIATHDADIAAGLGRVIELADGRIVQDDE